MLKFKGVALAGLAVVALASPLGAQSAAVPAPTAFPMIDQLEPEAEAALARMGAALRAMNSYEVRADWSKEAVFPGNVKLLRAGTSTITVQMPDRMLVDTVSDRSHRKFYFDGKKLTVVGVNIGKYVSFPVSGSLEDVLTTAADDYGIDFPLRDLFLWGSPQSDTERPTGGFRVGDATVDGVKVGHYVFRQSGVDFQVWLEDGAQALPRRMVITNTENAAQPQFIVNYHWNRAPQIAADSFTFTPGPNDKLVDFGTAKLTAK